MTKKNTGTKTPKKNKQKSSVGKIYKTTDGNLGGDKSNKKPRKVIAIEQRKSDGAVVVTKIYSKKGKNAADKSKYIQDVELQPGKKHQSITEPSIVSKRAIFGRKEEDNFSPITPQSMTTANDKLKKGELRKVRKGIQSDTKKHRKTYKKTVRRWKKGFKK